MTKLTAALFALALLAIVALAAMGFNQPSDDSRFVEEITRHNRKIPAIKYPEVDVLGRSIASFEILVVVPGCNVCSTIKSELTELVAKDRQTPILVLTPDKHGLEEIFEIENCRVSQFDSKSEYCRILPGFYYR